MKALILILSLLTAGGFADMTKQQIKEKIFKDAQDPNADMLREEREALFRDYLLKVRGFTQAEIVEMAKEYSKLPRNAGNGLDFELRDIAIAGLGYFDTRTTAEKYSEFFKPATGILDRIFGKTGLPDWSQWLLMGVFGIVAVPGVLKLINRKK